jgi:hypothetical protein
VKTERGAWEDKKYDMVLVQMVFPEFVTNMQRQSMFDYSKNSYPLVIKLNIPADADGTHLIKILFIFGRVVNTADCLS